MGTPGFIGGVEWQTSMLAKWMAKRGHKVSVVVWGNERDGEEIADGVRVIKLCPPRAGWPGLRFVHPKWTSLLSALRRADADVYYHNCGEASTGQIALWCARNRRGFVFSSASDVDCDPRLPELKTWKERALYRYGLRRASRVIVQTKVQQRMIREGFGVRAAVIPMPCRSPDATAMNPRISPPSDRVVWVGRVYQPKRPDRLMDVAEALPHVRFELIGPHYMDPCCRDALARAARLPNVTIHGRLEREAVAAQYKNAAVLLCTSDYEGFPNTFLEAWSHGLPVVSTFDPDGIIEERELGIIAKTTEKLVNGLQAMLTQSGLYNRTSTQALAYFRANHDADAVLPQFERSLTEAASSAKA